MTLADKLIYCNNRSKQNIYFVAPRTLLKEIEQEKLKYTLEKDMILIIQDKTFRIERG